MASLWKLCRNNRTWKVKDAEDQSDIDRLYQPEKPNSTKAVRYLNAWTYSLLILIVLVLFLFGLLVGFYLRESQNKDNSESLQSARKDGFDAVTLESVHENIIYNIKGERAIRYIHEFSESVVPLPDEDWDSVVFKKVKEEFERFGFDHVDVEEHDLGELLYGHYGRYTDFLQLWSANITIQDSIVLLRQGEISPAEKVRWAVQYGAAGVLLYQEEEIDGFSKDYIPTYSAADFTATGDSMYPTVPVQPVSLETANMILSHIQTRNLPKAWGQLINVTSTDHSQQGGVKARLHIYNKRVMKKIRNVIGTLLGNVETDRYVMIGAGRTAFHGSTTDPKSSTALLLELAQSLTQVRQQEKWQPLREIKVCSWGGQELSNAGLNDYIQAHNRVIQMDAVAYLSLDVPRIGTEAIQIKTSVSLIDLVQSVADRIADPNNPDVMLSHSWPKLTLDWLSASDYPLNCNHDNCYQEPVRHLLGIPFAAATFQQSTQAPNKDMLALDLHHHFKYHLAVARVTSLVLLRLVDDAVIGFNLGYTVQFVQQTIIKMVQIAQQLMDYEYGPLLIDLDTLYIAATKFKQYTTTDDFSANRKINDVLKNFDSLFISRIPHQSVPVHSLCQSRSFETLLYFMQAVEQFRITQNSSALSDYIASLRTSIRQATESINSLER
ncbi:hypothetical protein ACJMK2_018875 [Sinanodonta woodiana]|uniref:PA domain-containing protein n=1 Tax=Sinanodonta woodiana TaxID=1069815 RepID=A0ABD3UHG6_SINWO